MKTDKTKRLQQMCDQLEQACQNEIPHRELVAMVRAIAEFVTSLEQGADEELDRLRDRIAELEQGKTATDEYVWDPDDLTTVAFFKRLLGDRYFNHGGLLRVTGRLSGPSEIQKGDTLVVHVIGFETRRAAASEG